MRFYVNKLCVEIQYSFLLIIAFSMLFKSYEYLYILLFSALHELGHLITLYLFKGRADKLVFAYYGIGLKRRAELSYIKELIFLLSGIIVNLVFYLFGIHREINLVLIFINALPIYPLDCGRAFKLILNNILSLNVSDKLYNAFSIMIIIALIVLAVYVKSISLGLIIVYIIVYSLNNSVD